MLQFANTKNMEQEQSLIDTLAQNNKSATLLHSTAADREAGDGKGRSEPKAPQVGPNGEEKQNYQQQKEQQVQAKQKNLKQILRAYANQNNQVHTPHPFFTKVLIVDQPVEF